MNKNEFEYPQIDLKRTGAWLRLLCRHYGYSVKDLQNYLHISSNQAIYEWFNGHTLPSINNLLALSILLHRPMNELIVDNIHSVVYRDESEYTWEPTWKRCKSFILLLSNIYKVEL